MPVSVGEAFAGFTILRVLGAGGMGTVYLAAHPRLPRQDALKVLPTQWTADPQYRARFLREADLTSSLSHPNILGVHDRGEYDGQLWISMDYVGGTDASRLVREHHPDGLPVGEALEIITAVASALDYAHQRGLLHRDVKPANILLDPQAQRIFLADFGIARLIDDPSGLTATNMAVGTMAYAAPEQLRGEPLDGRTDQYALACTAFDLLTGAPPYVDSNPAVVITKHVAAPVPSLGERRPELAALDPVLARAMAKSPADRYPSCRDFARELSTLLSPPSGHVHQSPPAPPPGPPGPAPTLMTSTPRVSRPTLIASLAVTALLLVAAAIFAGVTFVQHHDRAGSTPSTATAATAHAFSGTYRADYGPGTDLEGKAVAGAPPMTGTWDVRSTCGSGGCIATASYVGGSGVVLVSNLVFDQVGGSWLAVGLGSTSCNDAPTEVWVVFTLQPQPDGTLSGETTRSTTNSCSTAKRDRNLHPHRRSRPLQGSRSGRLASAGGIPVHSPTRAIPRNNHLRERRFCAGTRRSHRPYGVSAHRRSVHELVPCDRRGGAPGVQRRQMDPQRRGHGALQSRRNREYQTQRGVSAARPAARSDSAAHRARPQRDDWKRLCRR